MPESGSYMGISCEFLRKQHYIKSCQMMLKRKVIMKQLIDTVSLIYRQFSRFGANCLLVGANRVAESDNFSWFKELIDNRVFSTLTKIMVFQEQELRKVMEEGKQSEAGSDLILTSLADFTSRQESYKSNVVHLRAIVDREEKITFKLNSAKDTMEMFSEATERNRMETLEERINEADTYKENCRSQLIPLELARAGFIEEAHRFRYMLCSSRAHILKRFRQVCNHSVSGFVTVFMALKENLKSAKKSPLLNDTAYVDVSKSVISMNEDSQASCKGATQENYSHQLMVFLKYLKDLSQEIGGFNKDLRRGIESIQGILLDSITKSFHVTQSCFEDVRTLIDVMDNAFLRMDSIAHQISIKEKQLSVLSKDIQKQVEIASALQKSTIKVRQMDPTTSKGSLAPLDCQRMQRLIHGIFKIIEEQSEAFIVWSESKRISTETLSNQSMESMAEDSLSLSMKDFLQEKEMKMNPVEELWLWEDWKDEETFRLPLAKLEQLHILLNKLKVCDQDVLSNTPEVVYECEFTPFKLKGSLEVRRKGVRFNCLTYVGRVAYADIERVFIKANNAEGMLCLGSKKGILCFSKLADPHKTCKIIEEKLTKTAQPSFQSRISKNYNNYQPGYLTDEEENELSSDTRAIKLKSFLPELQYFQQISSIVLEDVTIVTFFRECLSDTRVVINDIGYENLLVYSYSRSNVSAIESKWDPNPPTYFTGMMGNPITPKLLYSEKLVELEYEPSIKVAHFPPILYSKNFLKLFWINKQELILLTRTIHTNSPFANDYIIESAIRVREEDRNTKLDYFKRLTVLKNSHEKDQVTALINQEIDTLNKEFTKSILLKLNKKEVFVEDPFTLPTVKAVVKPVEKEGESNPQRALYLFLGCLVLVMILRKIL